MVLVEPMYIKMNINIQTQTSINAAYILHTSMPTQTHTAFLHIHLTKICSFFLETVTSTFADECGVLPVDTKGFKPHLTIMKLSRARKLWNKGT